MIKHFFYTWRHKALSRIYILCMVLFSMTYILAYFSTLYKKFFLCFKVFSDPHAISGVYMESTEKHFSLLCMIMLGFCMSVFFGIRLIDALPDSWILNKEQTHWEWLVILMHYPMFWYFGRYAEKFSTRLTFKNKTKWLSGYIFIYYKVLWANEIKFINK